MLKLPYREQVIRWREEYNIKFIVICGKPFYYCRDVESYLDRLVEQGVYDRLTALKIRVATIRYDIDLDEWLPRCLALKKWPYSHEELYRLTKTRSAVPLIRTKTAHGQMFFCWEDMVRHVEYNQKHARTKN